MRDSPVPVTQPTVDPAQHTATPRRMALEIGEVWLASGILGLSLAFLEATVAQGELSGAWRTARDIAELRRPEVTAHALGLIAVPLSLFIATSLSGSAEPPRSTEESAKRIIRSHIVTAVYVACAALLWMLSLSAVGHGAWLTMAITCLGAAFLCATFARLENIDGDVIKHAYAHNQARLARLRTLVPAGAETAPLPLRFHLFAPGLTAVVGGGLWLAGRHSPVGLLEAVLTALGVLVVQSLVWRATRSAKGEGRAGEGVASWLWQWREAASGLLVTVLLAVLVAMVPSGTNLAPLHWVLASVALLLGGLAGLLFQFHPAGIRAYRAETLSRIRAIESRMLRQAARLGQPDESPA